MPAKGVDRELIDKPYFHGLVPREDVADILEHEGEFMLRVTEPIAGRDQGVVLSVLYDNNISRDEGVKHYVVAHDAKSGFHCHKAAAPTIPAMVKKYVRDKIALDVAGRVTIRTKSRRQPWELRHSKVHLEKKLGEGAYGEVWSGVLANRQRTPVAVKQNHLGNLTKDQIKEVMSEARTMRKNQHANVARLIGVAALEEPLLIVMELASHGSLDSFLKKNATSARRKAEMCADAAYGLRFLKARNILHRDLAARNLLLFDDTVKLADFGKSQPGPSFDMQPGEKLPIRWLSPETMRNQRFTFPSEVWSFGIVCWEIFNDGVEPYPGMMVREANVKVLQGFRLGMPPDTPADVRTLVEQGVLVDEPLRLDIDVVAERLRQHTGRNEAPLPPPPTFDDDDDIDRAAGSVWDSPSRKSPDNKAHVIDPSASRGQRPRKKAGKSRHAEKSSKKKDKKTEKKPEEAKPKTK